MPPAPLHKLRQPDAATLRRGLRLDAGELRLIADTPPPAALLDRLTAQALWPLAARWLALSLPGREATWWACMCLDHTAPTTRPPAALRAARAAEAWVRTPDETTRHAAARAARHTPPDWPETWAAKAAASEHGAFGAARPVETAVMLAAVRGDPARRVARFAQFLQSGRDIAAGGAGRLPREAEQDTIQESA